MDVGNILENEGIEKAGKYKHEERRKEHGEGDAT